MAAVRQYELTDRNYFRADKSRHWEVFISKVLIKWGATWQTQQNGRASSEESDQPGRPPSLIRVFAVHMKKAWALSYPLSAQRWLWSHWADAQADLSLRWAHTHFVGFVMSWLKFCRYWRSAELRNRWKSKRFAGGLICRRTGTMFKTTKGTSQTSLRTNGRRDVFFKQEPALIVV